MKVLVGCSEDAYVDLNLAGSAHWVDTLVL